MTKSRAKYQRKALLDKVSKLHSVRVDLYKGTTISGDHGWIMRPFGRNEFYLGRTLAEAHQLVDSLLELREGN